MFLGFDKNDIKKGLGVLADKSKDIAKITVDAGKKGVAIASEKMEDYSQRSQRADNSNVSSSEMKKYEKYAQIIIDNVDDAVISRIFKNILYIEFARAYDYINSYIESYDDASDFEQYVLKFIEEKWDTREDEIREEEKELKETYKKIIYNSSNSVKQFFGVDLNYNEYILISQAILNITEKWKYNLEYSDKGSYLVKKAARDTAHFVGEMFDSMVTSTVREAERRNNCLSYHLNEMTDEQLEAYYNNQDNIEEKKDIIECYKESKKYDNIRVPRLMEMSIEELENLQKNAGI